MPVLPAFFRHVSHQLSHSNPSKSRESWRTAFGSSTYRKAKANKGDPYLLSTDYKELDNVESGHRLALAAKAGTTTTINARRSDNSIPAQTVEGLHGSPDTNALVSKSIQVESHPRPMTENNPIISQPAYFRK